MKSEIRQAVWSACMAVFTANTRSVCPLSEHKKYLAHFCRSCGFLTWIFALRAVFSTLMAAKAINDH